MNARKITFTNREENGSTYTTRGVVLEDGKVVTFGTGVDGKDSLWASVDSFEPNGLAVNVSHELGDATTISNEAVVAADEDNKVYGESLL